MSKIFRLHKEGTSTYENWNESPAFPYNTRNRDTIEDPEGDSSENEITSIPSPFARIDLIKNAFKEVCKLDRRTNEVNLDGNTIFHQMVSDSLDVGEIFFNIDRLKDQVEIIAWDPETMLEELKHSKSLGHQYFADALEKYMTSDAATYNFAKLRKMYILNYVNGPDELNIIGATSPATVFFSTSNNLEYVTNSISFGLDKPFDKKLQPLYKRDFEYIKFWFVLRRSIPEFAELFPEIHEYLEHTFRKINDPVKTGALRNITEATVNEYSVIDVYSSAQVDSAEILGYPLFFIRENYYNNSDFEIRSTREVNYKPLVLPVESGNKYSDLLYTTDKWGKLNVAPYFDKEQDLRKRALPNAVSQQPYLTVSDFLEDNLIRVPHKINKESYFDGNIKLDIDEKRSYLLPLKKRFFEFFTADDLIKGLPNEKKMLEMEPLAGRSVKVILRIPIKGKGRIDSIEYSRIYYHDNTPDVESNKGGIVECDFTGFIMPHVKFNKPDEDAFYRVTCVSTYSRNYNFTFFNGIIALLNIPTDCRNIDNSEAYKAKVYAVEKTNFEYIQITAPGDVKALIIPNFKEQNGVDAYEFAIDLGTSNTHIEYCKNGSKNTQVFTYNENDEQICSMFIPSLIKGTATQDDLREENPMIEKDFLPKKMGNNSDFAFPTRTVLSCAKSVDWTNTIRPFGLVNIPFTYDKRKNLQYNNVKHNIKWGKGEDQRAIEAYVDCLMIMLRNKVLLNNGDLRKTKVTWFYPISMAPKRLNKLRSTWNAAYLKYFANATTNCMTESSAPIHYFFRRYATATNLVNIDIGGGTTDIAFAKDKEVMHVTSFKFASNVLFENSFSDVDPNNGIVEYYKNTVCNLLKEKNLIELLDVFNGDNNAYPANMASFLFSLKNNSMTKELESKCLDFNYILQEDENFKIVFIIFYTAIIYHIAQIVKVKNVKMPRHITFSGNGSKVIRIITTDPKVLAKYTKLIFEEVIGQKYDGELDILGLDTDSNPKELTCKGGLLGIGTAADDKDKIIILKAKGDSLVSEEDTYDTIDDLYINQTITAVKDFFEFTLSRMNNLFNFDDNFGVEKKSLEIAKDICKKDIETYLRKGLAQCQEESDGKENIEETLFFYPIKGVLHSLSQSIYESLK